MEDRDYPAVCYYTDEYFDNTSYDYNPSLAMASICLGMALCDSNVIDYPDRWIHARDLLIEMEFDGITANDGLMYEPTVDNVGILAANKAYDSDTTLIVLALRAGDYRSEWANNFIVNKSGDAVGFANSKDVSINFLNEYITDNNITGNIKLWVFGYSRTASIANLVAGELNNKPSVLNKNVTLKHENMYAYCFGNMMAGINHGNTTNMVAGHENIHNVVNYDDMVTKSFSAAHGFGLYGQVHWLPNIVFDDDFKSKYEKFLIEYENFEINSDTFERNKGYTLLPKTLALSNLLVGQDALQDRINQYPMGAFVDEFFSIFYSEVIKSREEYTDNLQNMVSILFTTIYGTTFDGINSDSIGRFIESFIKKLFTPDILTRLVLSQTSVSQDAFGYSNEIINSLLTQSLNEVGINNLSPMEFKNIVDSTLELIAKTLMNCPDHFITFIDGFMSILSKHYPRLTYSWLILTDPNYVGNGNEIELPKTPNYRTIRINGDVDIEVYDSTGNTLLAKMVNGVTQSSHTDIAVTTNYEDEKIIFLPVTQDYQIKMTATGTGKVTCSVNEYSYSAYNFTRIINFADVSVTNGDILTGLASEFSSEEITGELLNGSTADYTLAHNSQSVQVASELRGKKVSNAYYNIHIDTNNDLMGIVVGRRTRMVGYYAIVSALPKFTNIFDGWYIGDKKVSDNLTYRFRVDGDIALTARFLPADSSKSSTESSIILPFINVNSMTHNINFNVNGGKSVRQQQVKHGDLLAQPDDPTKRNKEFAGWYTDEELTKEYDFTKPVVYSFVLYAKWVDVIND
jgi:Listeria-Bacteroides repeat domain (List_Bact_rpt).